MKQVCKAAVALFLLLVLALQSVPLVGAAGPVAYAEDADTETLQTEDAAISDAAKESDGEKYVEDLSAVDWDNVLSNRICLRRNKDVVPDEYPLSKTSSRSSSGKSSTVHWKSSGTTVGAAMPA